ncbi:MAG: TRM11 family SAM-dependent methyltransferase [Promethearchaeota archaeon]|jgi:tRNA G10  N-methylase Trm11
MNRFLFVLGSNWQLSLAELDNFLRNSQTKGRITDYSANVAIVEFEDLYKNKYYINELMEIQYLLGGCQKIAEIYDFVDIRTMFNAFPLKVEKFKLIEAKRNEILKVIRKSISKIFPKIQNESLFFAVSIYPNLYDDKYYSEVLVKHFLPFLNKEIMVLLKELGAKKSLYYQYPEENIKSGKLNPIFPHHVIKYGLFNKDRAEIIFGLTEEGFYIARTFTCDDPNFKKKTDEERPFKEFKSAISPKLALIMLNFLNLFEERENKKVLDPFVGNGTVLLFALIEDFQVYGSDIDENKVKNTIRNLNWLLDELEEPIPYMLNESIRQTNIEKLSSIFEEGQFDGIATEPDLGPFYKDKPYYTEVKALIDSKLKQKFEATFREANIVLKPNARISIVAPIFSTVDGGDVTLNMEELARKHNFKLIPLLDLNRIANKSNQKLQFQRNHARTMIDAKKGQIVKRKIYVFEKE